MGTTPQQFVRRFFFDEGERFLRSIFLACIDDNHISQNEWNNLLKTATQLGIGRDELLNAIAPRRTNLWNTCWPKPRLTGY